MYIANERIKEVRLVLKSISQEQFSKETGIALERIKKLEKGRVKASLDDVVAISDAYGISMDFLMGNRRLPAPVITSEEEALFWNRLEKLSIHELGEFCEELMKRMGINEDDAVITICYGKREEWKTRREAKEFYLQAMMGSEGSENQRYTTIYQKLSIGMKECSDEVD